MLARILFTLAVADFGNPVASTAVIPADHSTFGPVSLTRDTDQGLDFLDVTESINRSFDDVSGQFGTGGDFEGFRYATEGEVIALVNNFGFSPGAMAGTFVSGNTGGDQLSGLVDLLGATFNLATFRALEGLTGTTVMIGGDTGIRTVQMTDIFDPLANDTVSALGALVGSLSGTGLFINYDAGDGNDVALFASAGLPGDYNDNGVVDAADYTVWRDHLGQSNTLTNEDPDTTPGHVTQEDYAFWKANFGATAGATRQEPRPPNRPYRSRRRCCWR